MQHSRRYTEDVDDVFFQDVVHFRKITFKGPDLERITFQNSRQNRSKQLLEPPERQCKDLND